ncbi:hypothetical protein L914_21374, partial [Phytophthora nicotianae]
MVDTPRFEPDVAVEIAEAHGAVMTFGPPLHIHKSCLKDGAQFVLPDGSSRRVCGQIPS